MGLLTNITPPIFQKFNLGKNIFLLLLIAINLAFILSMRNNSNPSQDTVGSVPALAPGQSLTQEIVAAANSSEEVQYASGAYIPESGMVLYTKWEDGENLSIRVWATRLLATYATQFEALNSKESLIWVIDYGNAPVDQEIISAPLHRINEPSSYTYYTIPGIDLVEDVPETAVSNQSDNASFTELIDSFDNEAPGWVPINGNWEIRDGVYAQTDNTGFDLITMLDAPSLADYQVETAVRIVDGEMGLGIIFNAESTNSRNNSQILDFDQGGTFIRWGHYDADGNYAYDGGYQMDPPILNDGQWHQLRIDAIGTEAIFYLDDQEVGRFQNMGEGGHVGLSSSLSTAEFDNFRLTAGDAINQTVAQPVEEQPIEDQPIIDEPIPDETVIVIEQGEPNEPVLIQDPGILEPVQVFAGGFDNDALGWTTLGGDWVAVDGGYVQNNIEGFDMITMLEIEPLTHYSLETRIQSLDGNLGGGIVYNAPNRESRANAQIIDFIDQGSYLRFGHYNEGGDFVFDGGTPIDPPIAGGEWHILRIETHGEETAVYLDNEPVGTVTNLSTSGYVGLVTSQAHVKFDDVVVIELPRSAGVQASEDFFDNFDNDVAEDWIPFSGEWSIADGEFQQTQLGAFDLGAASPFKGSNYTLQADVKVLDGEMGAGFFFNMASRDNKSGSQMLNFIEQGNAVQWGAFNENGEFVFGGTADTKDVGDGEWHTLELTVSNGRADLLIDSEIVFQNIELNFTGGYAGLMVSNSSVAYDNVAFTQNENSASIALGDAIQIETTYTFDDESVPGWLPVAGDWNWVDGEYEQRQTNEFDRLSSFNVQMVAPYRFSSQMRYIEGEMGGGLIFNMQERDSKNQAHMVSFTANGTFLQWGTFNLSGIFNYQGGVPVPNTQDGNMHELAVEINEQTFNIILNGDAIATEIPLTYTSGYVGLFDGLSWVSFDNVQLSGLGRSLIVEGEAEIVETTEEDSTSEESEETTEDSSSADEVIENAETTSDETSDEATSSDEEDAEGDDA